LAALITTQFPVIIQTAKIRKEKIFPAVPIVIVLLNQWFRIVRQIVRIFFTAHMADIIATMTATARGVMVTLLG